MKKVLDDRRASVAREKAQAAANAVSAAPVGTGNTPAPAGFAVIGWGGPMVQVDATQSSSNAPATASTASTTTSSATAAAHAHAATTAKKAPKDVKKEAKSKKTGDK